jgi:hypothetical protein
MKAKFLSKTETYDGTQLVSLRNYLEHGILGDSVVAWIGPCDIPPEHMVDGEDLRQSARICGSLMLHFIIEKFDSSLLAAVALQRLFASIAKDELQASAVEREMALALMRNGDDLFAHGKKLSISIATQSPVSSLIHFAVNVHNLGTPVPTLSLADLKIDGRSWAEKVMARFCAEVESIVEATHKVRWVR